MQFAVTDRIQGAAEEDDGTFNAANPVHIQTLEKLFAMIMFFLEKWFPSSDRLGKVPRKAKGGK